MLGVELHGAWAIKGFMKSFLELCTDLRKVLTEEGMLRLLFQESTAERRVCFSVACWRTILSSALDHMFLSVCPQKPWAASTLRIVFALEGLQKPKVQSLGKGLVCRDVPPETLRTTRSSRVPKCLIVCCRQDPSPKYEPPKSPEMIVVGLYVQHLCGSFPK